MYTTFSNIESAEQIARFAKIYPKSTAAWMRAESEHVTLGSDPILATRDVMFKQGEGYVETFAGAARHHIAAALVNAP